MAPFPSASESESASPFASTSTTPTPSPSPSSTPSSKSSGLSSLTRTALIVIVAATIVLLLLVSITIVARSYALRRRQAALVAEAIANGTYVPPKKPGAVGEKPKMYEIFIGEEEEKEEVARDWQSGGRAASPEKEFKEKEKEKEPERFEDGLAVEWDRIMPVACRWLNDRDNPQSPVVAAAPNSAPTPPPSSPPSRRLSRFSLSSLPGRRMSSSSTSRDQAQSPVPPPSELTAVDRPDTRLSLLAEKPPLLTPEPPEEKVRVSVLISMPFADPSRKRKSMASALTAASTSTAASQGDSDLPYVELGTTEVSAGSLRSSLEVPATNAPSSTSPDLAAVATRTVDDNMGGRRVDPPLAVASYMNV